MARNGYDITSHHVPGASDNCMHPRFQTKIEAEEYGARLNAVIEEGDKPALPHERRNILPTNTRLFGPLGLLPRQSNVYAAELPGVRVPPHQDAVLDRTTQNTPAPLRSLVPGEWLALRADWCHKTQRFGESLVCYLLPDTHADLVQPDPQCPNTPSGFGFCKKGLRYADCYENSRF
ncbi:hypothetical protein ACCO45_012078 [Purpureocillium lilacinum]|uniref:Uncharacterized protein n=1 Tax=Purpureocillium lilacinum TaxID=33203 RepID=A0ACC4DE70_PURLI